MERISVIVPTYQRSALLPRVLEPLLRDPTGIDEILIVVDGCHDGSLELVERLAERHPVLRAVFIANRGEAGARHEGVRQATGDVVLLLDDDVVIDPGTAARHAVHHRRSDDLVVMGYMPVLVPEGDAEPATVIYADDYEGRCAAYERDPESVLRHLWMGNVSMRREQALRIGLESPRFGEAYHADRDFGLRCLEAGLTGVFDRTLTATHLHGRDLAAFRAQARIQGSARCVLHELHPGLVPELTEQRFEHGLPPWVRRLLHATRRPRLGRLVGETIAAAVGALAYPSCRSLQRSAMRLLRRIEQQEGVLAHHRATRRRDVLEAVHRSG